MKKFKAHRVLVESERLESPFGRKVLAELCCQLLHVVACTKHQRECVDVRWMERQIRTSAVCCGSCSSAERMQMKRCQVVAAAATAEPVATTYGTDIVSARFGSAVGVSTQCVRVSHTFIRQRVSVSRINQFVDMTWHSVSLCTLLRVFALRLNIMSDISSVAGSVLKPG